ncbi:hypothetical protein GJ744_002381 [Endocarpon pusillum]|uniref:Phosphatidate phosphatase APP1 catalytic domain-containing protein n=1 Tax=Endocarpon pusillum TaxID=364733 RepID=A0A8H7AQ11_9EURO|nr:hypothetical protein GJ744_002381 [Endocarpon pusillum]
MAQVDSTASMATSGWGEGRERGARRKKVYGYLKAANELRQSYQSQWAQSREQSDLEDEQGLPGAFADVEIVRSGNEEMVLFPSYARKHTKRRQTADYDKPGAGEDIAQSASSGDAEYWKRQWEKYEDDNAIVDIDVRGWIYTPHQGAITRKNRLVIAVARRLSGIPAPTPSPGSSRDSSRHSLHRESLEERAAWHEEEAAAKAAQSIVQRGEGEADAAWRGGYSQDPSKKVQGGSPYSTRSSSPVSQHEASDEPQPGHLRHAQTDSSLASEYDDPAIKSLAKRNSWNRPANMSKEELARANTLLMARLRPFMHLPLAGAPITVFFFNDQTSQSRSVNTNESGHFTLRASLNFVPTSIRVLASENLSATEKISIVESRGVSLISDIDDTIKHSAIAGGAKEIFYNTFIRELGDLTIKGVKEWYSRLAALGVQLHYVSNSPWQLYPLLRSYFALAGLPPGSFHLKQYSGMLQGIFEPAAERKKSSLDKILRDFPERKFILVGDSGEADLEVYSDVVMANPGRVLAVFIRDVTTAEKREFFDQSPSRPPGGRHQIAENDARRGAVLAQSDAPEARPSLPSRTREAAARAEPMPNSGGDLIDFNQDDQVHSPREASNHVDLQQLGQNDGTSPRSPPTRPSKPSSLRSTSNTQIRSTNHESSTVTTSSPTSPPPARTSPKNPGPPPKPRRSSSSINLSPNQHASFSSNRQNRRRAQPLNPPTLHNSAPNAQEEGYAISARRNVVSAYHTLPSPRTLWSSSPHATSYSSNTTPTQENPNPISSNTQSQAASLAPPPSSSRPSTRRNISSAAHSFASNRLSWGASAASAAATGANSGDPATEGNGGAPPGSPYNKKEEVWRRRWARAEELMRREGVVLRTWRVGGDVVDECMGLCERVLREMRVGKGGGEGERAREREWNGQSEERGRG